MRRSLAVTTVIAAAFGLGVVGFAPTAATADPGACDSDTAPRPFPAPAGSAFVVHYEPGADASRLESPVLDGALPDGCVIDDLGYNPTDGYLYALYDRAEGLPSLIRIGRTEDDEVAAATVGSLAGAPLVADVDDDGRYVAFSFNPLTRVGVVQTFAPTTGLRSDRPADLLATTTTANWGDSCDPLLNNLQAQERLRAKDPKLPRPESILYDWAFNPSDGRFYGYASVDAHDAYLGKVEPISKWTVKPLADQVIRVDPVEGTARCAAAANPAAPGGVDRGVIGDVYGNADAAVAGAAFIGPDRLTLFQLAKKQRWNLDVTECFDGSGCAPEPDGVAPAGLGDAAGNPYEPARVTVRAIVGKGSAPAPKNRQRFAFASKDLDPDGFALGPGESRTFDLAPGEVTLAKAREVSGWRLENTGCRGSRPTSAPQQAGVMDPNRVMLAPGEQLICTYAASLLTVPASVSASPSRSSMRARSDRSSRGEADGTSGIENRGVELPWNRRVIVSLPGSGSPLSALAGLVLLALTIGGVVYAVFPRTRPTKRGVKPGGPPYRARHRR